MPAKPLPAELSAWPKDPRAVLGLDGDVDRLGLKRAYAARLREFNPEHFPEHFRRIREAYEIVLRQVEWREQRSQPAGADESELPPAGFTMAPGLLNQIPQPPAPIPPAPAPKQAIPPAPNTKQPPEKSQSAPKPPPLPSANLSKPAPAAPVPPAPASPPNQQPTDSAPATGGPADWNDNLDALWNRAVGRDQRAYRAIVEFEARFNGRRDLCLRLYWLCVAWPQLDPKRVACDWLARGLRFSGLRGPLAELYRRELDRRPEEALSNRCGELLECDVLPSAIADLAEWRWRAAGRLGKFQTIAQDLVRLRPRIPAGDEAWGRMLLAAINEMSWSTAPEIQSIVESVWREIDQLSHLHTQLRYQMDRTELLRSIAVGWNSLHGERGMPDELLELARRSLLDNPEELAPAALRILDKLLNDESPLRLLMTLDRIGKRSPALLGQVGQLIAICGGIEPPGLRRDDGQIRALLCTAAESNYRKSYDELRPHLLEFCVQEQISPESLVKMPGVIMVQPDVVNRDLVRRVAADASLQLMYLAHVALGAVNWAG